MFSSDSKKIRLILLPGLHGTAHLFDSFIAASPSGFEIIPVTFPSDRIFTYEALATEIHNQIKDSSPAILLGESFSGPLALMITNMNRSGIFGVILVASFVLPPAPRWVRYLPWTLLFHLRAPLYLMRCLLAEANEGELVIQRVRNVIRGVKPQVLASRVRAALTVDARECLRCCQVPILYLAGSEDRLVRRKSLDAILRERPDVIYRELSAPHFVLQLSPEKAWAAISEFLQKYCKPQWEAM